MLSIPMVNATNTECHYTECRYAECRGAGTDRHVAQKTIYGQKKSFFVRSKI